MTINNDTLNKMNRKMANQKKQNKDKWEQLSIWTCHTEFCLGAIIDKSLLLSIRICEASSSSCRYSSICFLDLLWSGLCPRLTLTLIKMLTCSKAPYTCHGSTRACSRRPPGRSPHHRPWIHQKRSICLCWRCRVLQWSAPLQAQYRSYIWSPSHPLSLKQKISPPLTCAS